MAWFKFVTFINRTIYSKYIKIISFKEHDNYITTSFYNSE